MMQALKFLTLGIDWFNELKSKSAVSNMGTLTLSSMQIA